jgi:predicted YcjX-like family ATPase
MDSLKRKMTFRFRLSISKVSYGEWTLFYNLLSMSYLAFSTMYDTMFIIKVELIRSQLYELH